MSTDLFDPLPSGNWLRGRDYVGHWCLFMVKDIEKREGTFGNETVATIDFADLSSDELELETDCKISDPHIVGKFRVGARLVAKVSRAAAKQKGYQGAIFIEQPANEDYEDAREKARRLLESAPKQEKGTIKDLFA